MAETTSHTEAPGGKEPFPPFNSQTFPSQIVWLVISFAILWVVMAKVALPRVAAILDARRNRVSGDLEEAKRLKDESDAALAAYEKALADARNRAQALAAETRDKQAAAAEQHRKQLEDQLNHRLADAEKTIAATKSAAMANVRGIASDAASAIVARLVGQAPAREAVDTAVTDVLKS